MLVDEGSRVDFKGWAEPTQTAPSDEVPEPGAASEQASGQISSLEMVCDEFDSEARSISP